MLAIFCLKTEPHFRCLFLNFNLPRSLKLHLNLSEDFNDSFITRCWNSHVCKSRVIHPASRQITRYRKCSSSNYLILKAWFLRFDRSCTCSFSRHLCSFVEASLQLFEASLQLFEVSLQLCRHMIQPDLKKFCPICLRFYSKFVSPMLIASTVNIVHCKFLIYAMRIPLMFQIMFVLERKSR